jgi:hypothetical protein
MCVHRIDVGRPPACAEACIAEGGGAMLFGDLNDAQSDISRAVASRASTQVYADLGLDPGFRYENLRGRGGMAKMVFRRLEDHGAVLWVMIAAQFAALAAGLGAALYMEQHGHIVTGMNNQILWGTPHVFAVFLIVAASGALNVASISSVFNRLAYKPYARLSGVLAISLLAGGLMVLLLDLGRPKRVFLAMTHYNIRSIFA